MVRLARSVSFLFFLALITWITPPTLFAQGTGAEILGAVRDESGGVLPGVTVTVTNIDTGVARNLVTAADGRYRAQELSIGNYEVQAELQGFRPAVREGIQLTVGRTAVVDLTLTVGAIAETVTVTGEAPLVDVTTSSLGGLVGEEQIEELPLNGRNFVQLALLETGVSAVRTASQSVTFGAGLKMSVNGARMDYNNFMMDGTSMNSVNMTAVGGASGQALGTEAIQEFQVLTSNYSAEFGRAGGGVINAVTKSGTNRLSGSVSYFNRNDGMDSRDFFAVGDLPPFTRHQFGATGGGPILQNKTFFFAAYEGLRETLGQTFRGNVPTLAARQGILPTGTIAVHPEVSKYLDLYPVPNGPELGNGRAEFTRTDSTPVDQNFAQLRVDHNLSDADTLFVRYTRDVSDKSRPQTLGEVLFLDVIHNEYATVEYKRIMSPRLLNVLRVGYNVSDNDYTQQHLDARFDDPSYWFVPNAIASGLQLSVSGLSGLGGSRSIPRGRADNVWQVVNTTMFNPGRHSIRVGGEFQYILTKEEEIRQGRGAFTFTSLENFLRGQPREFNSASDTSDFKKNWRQDVVALFFQDDLRATDNLTLNMGVRWEFVTNPSERDGKAPHVNDPLVDTPADIVVGNPLVVMPKDNIAPRVGFAWAPGGSTTTSVRGGIGVFYPLMFRAYWALNKGLPPFADNIYAEAPNISFPHPLEGVVTRPLVRGDMFQYNADQPRVTQYNFTVQRELLPNTVLTMGYVGSRGVNATHAVIINNAIAQILPDGRKFFPEGSERRNPHWGAFRLKQTDSYSNYNALQMGLVHRVRGGLQAQASYTLSKSIDNASEFGTGGLGNHDVPQDWEDNDSERGYSSYDVRHLATFNVSYLLPAPAAQNFVGKLLEGWQIAGIVSISAGLPFTVYNSFDRDRDADNGSGRPDLVPGRSNNPVLGGHVQYFDPTAFRLQEAGFYGNVGRNTLIGPGVTTVDLALSKNTSIGGRWNVQLRAEAFNLLNRANFGMPESTLFRNARGVPAGDAGRIDETSTSARQVQLGLRIEF